MKHSACPVDAPEFPMIAAFEADVAAAKAKEARIATVRRHRASMTCCWPEWTAEVGGYCEVGICSAFSITHGAPRYHYMAPCRIMEISADGETFIVEVDYPHGTIATCLAKNGERLRLDITEVWAPVATLTAERRRQSA